MTSNVSREIELNIDFYKYKLATLKSILILTLWLDWPLQCFSKIYLRSQSGIFFIQNISFKSFSSYSILMREGG